MKTVKYAVTYKEDAGRLELFIRWFWAIPSCIVLFILEIIGEFAMFFQFLHILILGKRNDMLNKGISMFMSYSVNFASYFYFLSDERNPLMPGEAMKSVKFDVTYKEEASRLELFIRWFWAIPSYIVLVILAIIGVIAIGLQFLHILILGKRNETLNKGVMMYLSYALDFMGYFFLLTDERNPLMPEY